MAQLAIQIPFCGFYESEANALIDQEIESSFDYEGTGDADIPEDFYDHWGKANKAVEIAFSQEYVGYFLQYLKDECGLDIPSLRYKELVSPRYYNFETDRIFCEISKKDAVKLWNECDKNVLREVMYNRHTSYDGFFSFYSNKLSDWPKQVTDWDSVQLQTLLIAVMKSKGLDEIDYWSLMEPMSCNGVVHQVVWNNCAKECLDMINSYDAKHRA